MTTQKKPAARKPAAKTSKTVQETYADINIEVTPPKPLTANLAGVVYNVRPIKGSFGVSISQEMRAVNNDPAKMHLAFERLTVMLFGAKIAPEVIARLQDPDDVLDYPHVTSLMNAVVERASGNPLT